MHSRKFVQHLRKNGCEYIRTNKHIVYENQNNGRKSSIPKCPQDLRIGTIKKVCKALGIPNPY